MEGTLKIVVIILAVLAVLGLAGCMFCGLFSASLDAPTGSSVVGTQDQTGVTPGTQQTAVATLPTQSPEKSYRMGDVISVTSGDKIHFSVQQVIRGSAAWNIIENANMFNTEPDEGMEYIMYKIWVKNTDDEKISVNPYKFPVYGNGVEGETAWTTVLPDSYHDLRLLDLLPGAETSGWIVKEIPQGANCKVAYSPLFGTEIYVQV